MSARNRSHAGGDTKTRHEDHGDDGERHQGGESADMPARRMIAGAMSVPAEHAGEIGRAKQPDCQIGEPLDRGRATASSRPIKRVAADQQQHRAGAERRWRKGRSRGESGRFGAPIVARRPSRARRMRRRRKNNRTSPAENRHEAAAIRLVCDRLCVQKGEFESSSRRRGMAKPPLDPGQLAVEADRAVAGL